MKHNKTNLKGNIFMVLLIIQMISSAIIIHYISNESNQKYSEYEYQITTLKAENTNLQKDVTTYKTLWEDNESEIVDALNKADYAEQQLNDIKEQIKYSKLSYGTPNRGEFRNLDLRKFAITTIDEMNDYISKTAPEDSPFIGQGELFLKASKESGLNPKYIYSHAAVESSYGTSQMALSKGNYFGIGAFNSNPDNAHTFGSTMEAGIINGAVWISEEYTNNGYATINDMIYKDPDHRYAVYDDGSPNEKWAQDISYIATLE